MKRVVAIGISLVLSGLSSAGILKEEEVLGIAGFQHTGSLVEIVCLSDGKHVLSTSRDDFAALWEIESGKLVRKFVKAGSGDMWGMRLLPGEKEFLVGTNSNEVIRFELETGKVLKSYPHSDDVLRVALHPDGKRFVGVDDDKIGILWDLETGEEIRKFKGHEGRICTAIFVEEGKRLVTGSSDDKFKVWNVETGKCIETSKDRYGDIFTLAVSPDGKQFAMASADKHVRVFNAKTRKEVWKVKLRKEGEVVAFSPDSKLVAIADRDRYLYLLDSTDGKEVRKITVAGSSHTPVAFSTDGKTLISGGDQHLHLHDVETGKRIAPSMGIPAAPNGFDQVAVGPKGRRVYGSVDDKFYSWNRDLKGRPAMVDEKATIYSLAVSRDGKVTGVGLEGGAVRIRGVEDRELKISIETGADVSALVFSPTSRSVLSGGSDGRVAQWVLANGGRIQNFRGHTGKVNGIEVSSDGRTFATASDDESIRIWSLRRKIALARLPLAERKPNSFAFINDGRSVLAAVKDKNGQKKEVWGRFLPKVIAVVEVSVDRIQELLVDLANDQFEVRKAATDELFAMGEDVLPHLAKIKAKDPEVVARLDGVREMILGKGGQNAMEVVFNFKSTLNHITGDPSGRYWAAVTGSGASAKIILGEVVKEKITILEELGSERHPESVAFSADGKSLVSTNGDGTLTVYSVGDSK